MVAPLKLRNALVISSHTLLDMWLLIEAGIKVKLGIEKNHCPVGWKFSKQWILRTATKSAKKE